MKIRKSTALSTAVAGLFLSLTAFAANSQPGGGTAPDFAKHKQHFMEMLDKEMGIIQTAKSCASSAQDHEAMKKCHEQMHTSRDQLHEQMKQQRGQNLDQQIQKLQEEKAKLNQAPSSGSAH